MSSSTRNWDDSAFMRQFPSKHDQYMAKHSHITDANSAEREYEETLARATKMQKEARVRKVYKKMSEYMQRRGFERMSAVFNFLNSDRKHGVEFNEFVDFMKKSNMLGKEFTLEDLREAFDYADTDKNGAISLDEFAVVYNPSFVRNRGHDRSTVQMSRLETDVNVEHKRSVHHIDELRNRIIDKLGQRGRNTTGGGVGKALWQAYRYMDKNQDGMLTHDEFKHALGPNGFGLNLSNDELNDLVNAMDTNKDGFITADEFVFTILETGNPDLHDYFLDERMKMIHQMEKISKDTLKEIEEDNKKKMQYIEEMTNKRMPNQSINEPQNELQDSLATAVQESTAFKGKRARFETMQQTNRDKTWQQYNMKNGLQTPNDLQFAARKYIPMGASRRMHIASHDIFDNSGVDYGYNYDPHATTNSDLYSPTKSERMNSGNRSDVHRHSSSNDRVKKFYMTSNSNAYTRDAINPQVYENKVRETELEMMRRAENGRRRFQREKDVIDRVDQYEQRKLQQARARIAHKQLARVRTLSTMKTYEDGMQHRQANLGRRRYDHNHPVASRNREGHYGKLWGGTVMVHQRVRHKTYT